VSHKLEKQNGGEEEMMHVVGFIGRDAKGIMGTFPQVF